MKKYLLFFLLMLLPWVGNTTFPTISFWQMGTKPPIATVNSTGLGASPSNDLSTRSVTVAGVAIINYKAFVITSGTCTSPGVGANILAAPTYSVVLPFYFTPPGGTTDTYFTVCVIGQNYAGYWQSELQPTSSLTIRVNTILPVVTSLTLNNGTDPTNRGSIPTSFSATHTNLNITHFCYKSWLSTLPPTAPTASDSCWRPVDAPSPGVAPSTSISFSGLYYTLGFATGRYYVFAWAKAINGAISALGNLGAGTTGTDKNDIQFFQGSPPVIINAMSVNTNSPSTPVTKAEMLIPSGQTVYIKWKLTDDQALPAQTVSLSYTTDETNFTDIISNLSNAAHAGCTVDGVNHTGCYTWTNGSPSSAYFKVRVTAIDASSLVTFSSAPPNNTTPFEVLAGNMDPGLGSSAAAAVLSGRLNGYANPDLSDAGSMVVTENGKFYFIDRRGLMIVDPADGKYNRIMSITGSATNGALGVATLSAIPLKIALDFNNGLLIWDGTLIRRLNISTGIVSNFIGGGASKADGVLAADFQLGPRPTTSATDALFVPLPNGDFWFTSGDEVNIVRNSGAKIRVYKASDGRIYEKIPTGTGSLEDGAFDPSTYPIMNFGIEFNPSTSAVTKIRSRSAIPVTGSYTPRSVSYDPTTMVTTTPHVKWNGSTGDDPTITAPTGEMYAIQVYPSANPGLFKYNSGTNTWTRIYGTSTIGQCPDGTLATACDAHVIDAYISAQGIVYVKDRGRIRTIDNDGKVLTLFGQPLDFGDGGLATSARLADIDYIDRASDGKIVAFDNGEFKLREFLPGGNMALVAGNGSKVTQDLVTPADQQGLKPFYFSTTLSFAIDTADNDAIYFNRDKRIAKLTRSTKMWSDVMGQGATNYMSADGMAGANIKLGSYGTGVFGFDGTNLLAPIQSYSAGVTDGVIKTYAKSNGQQSHLMGVSGLTSGSIYTCADGLAAATCTAGATLSNVFRKALWDAANTRWLMLAGSQNKIRTVVPGGNVGTINIPRQIRAFTHVVKSGVPYFYYCSSAAAGRMYKYNLNTSAETTLFWPSSTISCAGSSMVWDSTRQSIIFPITQNGLAGIAEILDP